MVGVWLLVGSVCVLATTPLGTGKESYVIRAKAGGPGCGVSSLALAAHAGRAPGTGIAPKGSPGMGGVCARDTGQAQSALTVTKTTMAVTARHNASMSDVTAMVCVITGGQVTADVPVTGTGIPMSRARNA